MATYVLVHGGQHGGWCWQRVARRLRAAGHEVYTPTLTGLGERAHLLRPETGLETHVVDVATTLEYEDLDDAILVGHSYGGMVVTGVAGRAPGRVGHIVYLDAAMPRDGESLVDLAPELMAMSKSYVGTVDGVEVVLFPVEMFLDLMGIQERDDRSWVGPRLTPQPWRSFADPLHVEDQAAVDATPISVVVTPLRVRNDEDRWRPARDSGRVWEVDTGHDLMVTEPDLTTEILLQAAHP